MNQSNNRFKQILIASDTYDTIKELGRTGNPFNHVLRELIGKTKYEGDKKA